MAYGKYIKWFQEFYPEKVQEMKNCSHHYIDENGKEFQNDYHLEGDIWTHTCMVVRVAEMMNSCDTVKKAALLHDIGKPLARFENVEQRKARFIGHEGVSFFAAINVAKDIADNENELVEILRIVAMHGIIFEYFREKISEKSLINLAHNFSSEDFDFFDKLCAQVNADNDGRFFPGHQPFEEWILPYFDKTFYSNFKQKKERPENCSLLHFLIGPQLSGKSTYAKKLSGVVLERDVFKKEYMKKTGISLEDIKKEDESAIEEIFDKEFEIFLKMKKDIILDRPNMNKSTRKKFSKKAENYYKIAYIMATDINVLFNRGELVGLTKDEIIQKCKAFSFPGYDEVDEIVFVFS